MLVLALEFSRDGAVHACATRQDLPARSRARHDRARTGRVASQGARSAGGKASPGDDPLGRSLKTEERGARRGTQRPGNVADGLPRPSENTPLGVFPPAHPLAGREAVRHRPTWTQRRVASVQLGSGRSPKDRHHSLERR